MKRGSVILFCLVISQFIYAQKKTPAQTKDTSGVNSGLAGLFSGKKEGPKPYADVITAKAVSQPGLFVVHKVEDKYFFELADSVMNREIMAVTRYVKVPTNSGFGRGAYGGEVANSQTIAFEKGPNNNVFMRVITLVNVADSSNAISTAVNNSNLNPIAAAFNIAAYGPDSTSVVIDVTDYFKGDNQVVSVSQSAKRVFNLSSLASDRSYIQSVHAYPINVEVRTVKTFNSSAGIPGLFSASTTSTLPAASAAGAVTIELNTSMILLPKEPMNVRFWDRRVGFFADRYTSFADDQQRVQTNTFAIRWRLEPKDEDVERWKQGQLVEPKKPIVYYIDPATPKKWRSYLIQGINDWQKAFEAAGFKNAIVGKEWPVNDTTMSLEDARYSVLRYFASDVENAYGPEIHDPRSGEILESHIGWYHNVMKLVHDWYMIQAAAVDPRARKMKYNDTLMGQLIRFVSSHEVGHTLGLRHNMGSSSTTPVEKLRDKQWVEKHGHTGSIMDYARFNYVAQPEDSIGPLGLFPKIGDYDLWAIRWGYGYIPGSSIDEKKAESNKLIIKALAANPRHYFGTYEFGNSSDPRNQSEDLGDNAMLAGAYGIKNLKFILKNLVSWTTETNDQNQNINEMYDKLLLQFRRYMGHVAANIGGVYETIRTSEQNEAVYQVTPKAKQKEALAFLQQQVLNTPYWLLNGDILNRVTNPGDDNGVTQTQEYVLNSLMNPERLNRMQDSYDRYGNQQAYSPLELLNDIRQGLFSELQSHKPIDSYRRKLQKSFVTKLNSMVNPATTGTMFILMAGPNAMSASELNRSDIPSIARAQLQSLQKQLQAAAGKVPDTMSKIHLNDLNERVKLALDPKS